MKNNSILKYLKKKKKLVIICILLCIIVMALGIIFPIINAKLINEIANINLDSIILIAIVIFFLALISRFSEYYLHEMWRKLHQYLTLEIEKSITLELFSLETKNFDTKGTGFFMTRLREEPANMTAKLISLRDYIMNIITGLGVLIFIITINIHMALYMIIGSLIVCFISVLKSNKKYQLINKEKDLRENDKTNFGEIIRGIRDIKVLNFKDTMIKKAYLRQEKLNDASITTAKIEHKFDVLGKIVIVFFDLFLLVLGVSLIKNNQLSGASLLILYYYSGRILELSMWFSYFYDALSQYNLSKNRLYEVINGLKYKKEVFGNISIDKVKGNIEFKDVCFSYNKEIVLNNMNLIIKPNETIGIVGKSGNGKTTMFNLLSKLYTINSGEILIDGYNINDLTEDTIRENISVITQNPYIFNMSIKDNLKIVNPNITDEEMYKKAKMTFLDEFVNKLENGYDTIVGEGGVTLSGGQKQRIAITRALIKESKIILLDEATSSLDNKTQETIHEAIKKISKYYTILIIAHRLSTIKDCNRILVVDKGKIVADGSHDTLINKSIIYKSLYDADILK